MTEKWVVDESADRYLVHIVETVRRNKIRYIYREGNIIVFPYRKDQLSYEIYLEEINFYSDPKFEWVRDSILEAISLYGLFNSGNLDEAGSRKFEMNPI